MDNFFAIIALAILIEAIVTYIKELSQEWHWGYVGPIALGILIALAYGLDLPAELGIVAKFPAVGEVMTGIVMARGSNYLYDLIGKLTKGA